MSVDVTIGDMPRYNIPNGPSGYPTLSASQFRKYGTAAFSVAFEEASKGCPRQYYFRYISDERIVEEPGYPLIYGRLWHSVMQTMEDEGLTPDEALEKAFDPTMPTEAWTEAREDLQKYMSRGASPSDRFHSLASEIELDALLYVDEDFGPIHYRGFLDWIGFDPEFPHIVHSVDYKTLRQPASRKDLDGDVQLRGYDWLVRMNSERFTPGRTPKIITHLDLIKWSDMEIGYSDSDIEDWHTWAVAMARKILRDTTHTPITNTWCSSCPVKDSCPAFEGMPMEAYALEKEAVGLESLEAKQEWADRANAVRLSLEKSVKAVRDEIEKAAIGSPAQSLEVGGNIYSVVPNFKKQVNMRELHEILGNEDLYKVASTSEAQIKKLVKDWPLYEAAKVLDVVRQVADGTKVARKK